MRDVIARKELLKKIAGVKMVDTVRALEYDAAWTEAFERPVAVERGFGADHESVLQCPCGGENIHAIRVAHRLTVHPGNVTDIDVRVLFECEHCLDLHWLSIRQHKGTTFLSWVAKIQTARKVP